MNSKTSLLPVPSDGQPIPITAVIIENDIIAIEMLCNELARYNWVNVAGTALNAADAVALVESRKPQLVFLDIELDDSSGLDLMEEMAAILPGDAKVVFYTAYSRYLINALRLQAFDFLLKPVDPDELSLIMERCRLHLQGRPLPLHTPLPPPETPFRPAADTARSFAITTFTNDRVVVAAADIVYFKYETAHKTWVAVLKNMKRYVLRRHTTAEMLTSLSSHFVRTHKTYIVNITYLAMITSGGCTLLPPYDNITEIKISRAYRRELLDCFLEL